MQNGFISEFSGNYEDIPKNALYISIDQLNLSVFPKEVLDEHPLLIFVESKEEVSFLPFHLKKIAYIWSAQRHFALECAEKGFAVLYLSGTEKYDEQLHAWLKEHKDVSLKYMQPAELDLHERMQKLVADFNGRAEEMANTFFMSDPKDWKKKIADGYVMEFFYREMRKRTGYLMNGDQPEGGEWNYDKENRKKLPKSKTPPPVKEFKPDDITKKVIELVREEFNGHIGKIDDFNYAVTRTQALEAMDDFFDNRFKDFGPYEDAMATGKPHVYHSVLSMYMNNGLLLPYELCERAIEEYKAGNAPINSVEGYVRQIIGWREYIRNYYEAMMPEVREANEFGFEHAVPQSFWNGDTKMKCISECVKPVLEEAYSHHIPRLMVLSNYSNLTETDPRELFRWFWYAYADAWEWVVLPNVLGMSTFADGGVLASKPYVASGNYINKMSDYCKNCHYSVKEKTGEKACPLNYLYWNFVDKQRNAFEENGRISFMVNMFDKKSNEEKNTIHEESEAYISGLKRYGG